MTPPIPGSASGDAPALAQRCQQPGRSGWLAAVALADRAVEARVGGAEPGGPLVEGVAGHPPPAELQAFPVAIAVLAAPRRDHHGRRGRRVALPVVEVQRG